MHIAEIRTVAKSLPPLRWNTHKSLILSYSADFSVIFHKKHPYYGSSSGRDEYYALTYYILEDYRKSVSFLDKIISLRKREDYNLFLDKIENARLLKDYIERGDYDKGVSQILEWQEQTMKGIKL